MRRCALFCRFLAAFIACSAALGCSGSREEPTYDVSGTVTIDGAPLADGFINFESEPPDGKPVGSAQITKGNYATKARAGKKKVTITSNKSTGEKDSGGFDITVNWLPARYNANSTLTAEVTAEGPNKFDFALKK
jgi:hypothetical protein